MKNKELFSHFAMVIAAANIEKSKKFYTGSLGFTITFEWGSPTTYVVMKRGEYVSLHLTKDPHKSRPSPVATSAYIFVHDIDLLHQEFIERDVEIYNPIDNRDYGMRDFDILDPDGYILTFGTAVEKD